MFYYAVKTEKSVARGEDYFTVIAHGTKKMMMKWAEEFDALSDTIASKVVRKKDDATVHAYNR